MLPVPEIAPGFIVHVPAGKPFNITLPVASAQVGWIMAPTDGAAGVEGWVLIVTFTVAAEVHPILLVTVKE